MPNRCTWVDELEIEPLDGENLHFTIISGAERIRFCMPRYLAQAVSSKTKRMLDAAEVMAQMERGAVPILGYAR